MATNSKPTSLTGARVADPVVAPTSVPAATPARRGRPPKSATAAQAPTLQRIVMAAAETMLSRGIQGLSMEQVAQKVGVTPGALYRHFTDRAHLVRETAEYILSAFSPAAAWLEAGATIDVTRVPATASTLSNPAAESIRRFMVDVVATALSDPEFLDQIQVLNGKLIATLERSIRAAQEAGTVRPDLPVAYAARWVLVQLSGLAAVDVVDPGLSRDPGWNAFVAERMREALRPA